MSYIKKVQGSQFVYDENDELIGVLNSKGDLRLFELRLPYDVNPSDGVQASYTIAQDEEDLIVLTANEYGGAGNSITVTATQQTGASKALSVSATGNAITILLGTSSGSSANSTAAQVIAAINANTNASALVTAALVEGATSTTVMAAFDITLEDGVNVTEGPVGCLATDGAGTYRKEDAQTWLPGRHIGAFSDSTTQENAGATSANVMTFDTTDISLGIEVLEDSQVTVSKSSVYNIQFSAQFARAEGEAGFSTADVWLAVNGTPVASSRGAVNVPQSGGKSIAAWNYVIELEADDYIELYWSSSDTEMEMWSDDVATNPTRPAIPSIILTITEAV